MKQGRANRMTSLQTVAEREVVLLAPYAMHSIDSRGRKHPEPEHPYRGPFQRDRDRVVHSAAYRRLSGKMQVFTGDMGDYHRTRLTHTHEVASIARTLGRALRLNEDLIEALALFHDIGHPPFGHAGEQMLDELLAGEGGFSHNRQALTIAEELELRYHQFPGLNLTREVLDGQLVRIGGDRPQSAALLEVQIVDVADSITYDAHDTDDAVKLGLVELQELAEIPLVGRMLRRVRQRYAAVSGAMLRKAVVHELIDHQVSDVLRKAEKTLRHTAPVDAADVLRRRVTLGPTEQLAQEKAELEQFLYRRVYRHPQLVAIRTAAQEKLRVLFELLVARPHLLPAKFRSRAKTKGVPRSVADYLAGMTDRFCESQYRKLAAGRGGA